MVNKQWDCLIDRQVGRSFRTTYPLAIVTKGGSYNCFRKETFAPLGRRFRSSWCDERSSEIISKELVEW